MKQLVFALLTFITTTFRSRRSLQMEIVVLRNQLAAYRRTERKPRIKPGGSGQGDVLYGELLILLLIAA